MAKFRVTNPRIFGSVLHGTDGPDNDLDLLVDALPTTTLLDLEDLEAELTALLGVQVNVWTPGDLPPYFSDTVVAEAKPL